MNVGDSRDAILKMILYNVLTTLHNLRGRLHFASALSSCSKCNSAYSEEWWLWMWVIQKMLLLFK